MGVPRNLKSRDGVVRKRRGCDIRSWQDVSGSIFVMRCNQFYKIFTMLTRR